MSASEIPLTARIAQSSDYKVIVRLCKRAVGPRDYVLSALKNVIAQEGLLLAFNKGELLGMVNFEKSIDGSGWLGMGRTDPDWRRRGVALFLQQQIAAYARRNGIKGLRLWVLSRNKPSFLAAMKGGFRPVCEAAHVTNTVRVGGKVRRTSPPDSVPLKSMRSMLRSPYLSKMNGYFAYKWHFVKASPDLLEKVIEKGELYENGGVSFILTKPEIHFGRRYSSFTPLIGSAASNLPQIKALAKSCGPITLGSYLPYNGHLLSVARKNGFRRDSWSNHCIVFEKRI